MANEFEYEAITIMVKREANSAPVVDIGTMNIHAAAGIVRACAEAMEEACPWPIIEANGVPVELVRAAPDDDEEE